MKTWDYSFVVWPDEQSPRWNKAAIAVFMLLRQRIVVEFTEKEFNDSREELFKVGLTLREVERVPHHIPETVH